MPIISWEKREDAVPAVIMVDTVVLCSKAWPIRSLELLIPSISVVLVRYGSSMSRVALRANVVMNVRRTGCRSDLSAQ